MFHTYYVIFHLNVIQKSFYVLYIDFITIYLERNLSNKIYGLLENS